MQILQKEKIYIKQMTIKIQIIFYNERATMLWDETK